MTKNWPALCKEYAHLYKHRLEINFSKRATIFFCSLHGFTLLVLWSAISSLPVVINVVMQIACIYSLYLALTKQAFVSHSQAIQKITKSSVHNTWTLFSKQGTPYPAKLLGHSLITSHFMLLNFKINDRYFPLSVLLFKDAIPTDDWQTLKIYCRFLPASFWTTD